MRRARWERASGAARDAGRSGSGLRNAGKPTAASTGASGGGKRRREEVARFDAARCNRTQMIIMVLSGLRKVVALHQPSLGVCSLSSLSLPAEVPFVRETPIYLRR